MEEEEKKVRKVQLQKYVSPRASKFSLIKFSFYAFVLIGLIWLIFSQFQKILDKKELKPKEMKIEIEQN